MNEQEKFEFVFHLGHFMGENETNPLIRIEWVYQAIEIFKQQGYNKEAEEIVNKLNLIHENIRDIRNISIEIGTKIVVKENINIPDLGFD